MFVDECTIRVVAGRGGAGCVSFRREKFVPRGGPDGGDGGDGGSVWLRVNPNLRTLSHLRHTPTFRAGNGKPGMGKQMFGARGESIWIAVPPGTVVVDHESGELLADAVEPEAEVLLASGGRGGRGNVHFKRPTRRVPRIAGRGTGGESRALRLTLRLLADVGLVGLPNAGKSTLLARLSNARPKVADYPFTTLEPKLGIVGLDAYRTLLMADLPGLIEGASEGKGLGQRFLRHIERTRFLLLLIDALDPDPAGVYAVLRRELSEWSPELGRRSFRVCYSKIDLLGEEARAALPQLGEEPPLTFSAHTGEGIKRLLHVLEEQALDTSDGSLPAPVRSAEGAGATAGSLWRPAEAGATNAEFPAEDSGDGGTVVRPPGADADDEPRIGADYPWPHGWVIPRREGAWVMATLDEEDAS